MIGTIDIKVNAAKPNFPLSPLYAFVNSPSQIRVINVPKAIGDWEITKVYVTANYPDNASRSVECSLDGGCWHGTLVGSTVTGTSLNGFSITADGVKEDGETAVTGYVLGKGDVQILDTDGTVTAGETTYYIHVLDSQPTTPKKGDAYVDTGYWKVYNGSSWVTLGGAFGSAQYVQYPVSEGGDGKWHRVIISDGAIAYDETGVDEPPTCATQTWVTAQIAAETTARTTAISAEATARASADESEVTNRNSAIASAIATEVTDRNAAIATETSARTAAISAEATARANADTAEATARDSAIASAIAAEVTNRNSAISTAVAAEKTRAEGAEDELNDAIVNEVARASAAEATKVPLSGAATISGVKTFTSSPIVPTPTANMEAATKKYADDVVASEASARASAVSAEATARNTAIATAIAVGTSGNDLVHKSGTETITGAKTFSSEGRLKIKCTKDALDGIVLLKTDYPEQGTAPSNNSYSSVQFATGGGTRIGELRYSVDTSENHTLALDVINSASGTTYETSFGLSVTPDGATKLLTGASKCQGSAFAAAGMPYFASKTEGIFDLSSTSTQSSYTSNSKNRHYFVSLDFSSSTSVVFSIISMTDSTNKIQSNYYGQRIVIDRDIPSGYYCQLTLSAVPSSSRGNFICLLNAEVS